MVEPHEGHVELKHTFAEAFDWLVKNGPLNLSTQNGARFEASGDVTQKGDHAGETVIRFFQRKKEFGRSYSCCWGKYHNCNRTRIGMYFTAVDKKIANNE